MKVKYNKGIPTYHLNMQETEELEKTGFTITINPITDEVVCFTKVDNKYKAWSSCNEYEEIKLSYTRKQEEED